MRVSRHFNCSSSIATPKFSTQLRLYQLRSSRLMSQSRIMSTFNMQIENSEPQTAPGVELSPQQKTLVGSVLDLFQGKPSKEKLQLWDDEATFEDPLTIAKGRKKFEPQWYGLQQAFSKIDRLSYQVTSSGNPITMDLKTRYTVKGIGKETTVSSKVNIFTSPDGSKISRVEDKWDGKLPDSSIADVSNILQLVNLLWWMNYWAGWLYWFWSFVWWTRPWLVFRKLNSVTVPHLVSVPKSAEEEAKKSS